MRLSQRSFPHPVVGNGDDVPAAAFQAALEFSSDAENYYIAATIQCSSKTLNALVAECGAAYVIHVECSNTVFRKAYEFSDEARRFAFPADSLHGLVEVNVFVVAKKSIPDYRVDGSHADYAGAAFDVGPGDILATAEGQTFFADNKHDSLRSVGSIMQIEESREDGDQPMAVDFGAQKIRIILSKKDFAQYRELKQITAIATPLSTSIVFPVLVEALHHAKEEREELDALRWYRGLMRRLDELGLKPGEDALFAAQKLLEMPIRRTLASAQLLSAENARE